MRFLMTIGGVASLGLAVLLCLPFGRLVWQEISLRRSARKTSFEDLVSGQYSHHGSPSEMIISVGPLTLSGWRLWAAAGGLVAIGFLFGWLGAYALLSREPGS
jgi:ABC-type antimicrobial peptide transport system permease subunit